MVKSLTRITQPGTDCTTDHPVKIVLAKAKAREIIVKYLSGYGLESMKSISPLFHSFLVILLIFMLGLS